MKYALHINILLVVFYNFVALKSTIIGISFLTAAFIDSLITSGAYCYVLKVFLPVTTHKLERVFLSLGAFTNYVYKIWLFLTTYPPPFTFSML